MAYKLYLLLLWALIQALISRIHGHTLPTSIQAKFTKEGNKCVLPFKWNGVKYNTCAPGANQPHRWCATSINADITYKTWGVCAHPDECIDFRNNCAESKFQCSNNTFVQDNCKKTCKRCNPEKENIEYKFANKFFSIWNNEGSKRDEDLSIWELAYLAPGYCSLGDVTHGALFKGPRNSLIVAKGIGGVKHPESFTQIWNDYVSGTFINVTLYRMNPPPGYVCLGDVAVKTNTVYPDITQYCCVESYYTTDDVDVERTYKDYGTGLNLWTTKRTRFSDGIESNNLLTGIGNDKPSNGKLINGLRATQTPWALEFDD